MLRQLVRGRVIPEQTQLTNLRNVLLRMDLGLSGAQIHCRLGRLQEECRTC